MTALLLAPKWQKAANGGFDKFGSFQPYLTQRQLDWATMMFNETPLAYFLLMLFGGGRHCGRQGQQGGEDQRGRWQ